MLKNLTKEKNDTFGVLAYKTNAEFFIAQNAINMEFRKYIYIIDEVLGMYHYK